MTQIRKNIKKQAISYNGYFQTRIDEIVYLLLKQLEASEEPAGALSLQEKLLEHGVECSPATIGRYLRGLDLKKYTDQQSNQGRVLTAAGREYLAELEAQMERGPVTRGGIEINGNPRLRYACGSAQRAYYDRKGNQRPGSPQRNAEGTGRADGGVE